MSEWFISKAEQLIRREVELIEKSLYPGTEMARGYVEMAYALGLLADDAHAYWNRRIDLTAMNRRQQLRALRNQQIIGAAS